MVTAKLIAGHLRHPDPTPGNLMYASSLEALIKFDKTGFMIKNHHCAPTSILQSAAECQNVLERFPQFLSGCTREPIRTTKAAEQLRTEATDWACEKHFKI